MNDSQRIKLSFVAIAIVTLASGLEAQRPFTVEQILSSPFPSSLVASPTGSRLAWVQNDEGRRNIWIAEGPDYEGRQITSYSEDDGQDLGSLRFTNDGTTIVFVRGGAPNRQGEIPNPLSLPDEQERAIWTVPFSGGEPQKLAVGSSPAVSPDGQTVLFIRSRQIWSVAFGEEAEKLFHIRGSARSVRWSPDGSKVAFVSARGDHSFVGVYDLEEETVRYLSPGVESDGEPVWSLDGESIAFMRVPPQMDRVPFSPVRSADPWSILVANVATGETEVVWTADEGPGSAVRGVVADNQLFWGDDDRLVFPWEKDGWTHLYSVRASGGEATLLTPGDFEVEDVVLSYDKREILFSSNQDDIDRRHIWRVSVRGGSPEPVTSGDGNEWAPAISGDGIAVAFLASDARHPAHAAVDVGSGHSQALVSENVFGEVPVQELVEPQQVIFPGADGMPIHGQLFLPPNRQRGQQYPAVLFFHGGSRRQMLLGWHYRGYYHNAYGLNQYLASRGYIVLSVNFRSGIGYGMEFREALNYGAQGASEFNDVLGSGLYLRSRPDVDPARIGLWGGSYGGYLTALGLARASDLFAAGADFHGVHDWNAVIRNFVPSYDPIARAEVARLAYESSPMASIDGWRSPVLLVHGDDDRNVPFSETVDLVAALRERGVEYEQLIFPDEVHGFLLHRHWVAAYEATADFFERKLKGR